VNNNDQLRKIMSDMELNAPQLESLCGFNDKGKPIVSRFTIHSWVQDGRRNLPDVTLFYIKHKLGIE